MTVEYDVIIAGCGPSGLMAAVRLHSANPALKIAVLEKETIAGGRLRTSNQAQHIWGYGLNAISPDLYNFWDQTLKSDPEAPDLPSITKIRQEKVGVLAAGRINEVGVTEFFSGSGARAVAGAAAARDWKNLENLVEKVSADDGKDSAFGAAWSGSKQSPAVVALMHMAHTYGIADLWSSSTKALIERAKSVSAKRYEGQWDKAFHLFESHLQNQDQIDIKTRCCIIDADYNDSRWHLTTEQGEFEANALIVAQPPWEALNWLPKQYWPETLLTMAIKTKPTSIVVLVETFEGADSDNELADLILVPAEEVQIVVTPTGEICYQATLDFEISMQAPDVVKAVKRLKRARKKLHATVPNLKVSGEHIALLPVGWAQPTSFNDRRLLAKLGDMNFNTKSLAFCGDAYGASYDGDRNFIDSLLSACSQVGGVSVESSI